MTTPADDDDLPLAPDVLTTWLNIKRVELLADPTGDFRPGARFDTDEIVMYGSQWMHNGKGAPVREWVSPGMMFGVYARGGLHRYWVTPEYKIARVAT